ncbi:MAG: hypothetical protein RR598_10890 [Anaerorhabdus sp.]
MTEKEVDLLLKQFKGHVNGLMNCEDELVDIKYQLRGVKKSKSKSISDEAQPDGTKIYKNTVISLEEKLLQVRKERNYHLFAVRLVMNMLKTLGNDEIELLELYYWDELSLKAVSKRNKFKYDISTISRRINSILEKMQMFA